MAAQGWGCSDNPGEGHQQSRANAEGVGECQPRVGAAATTLGKAINRTEQTLKALANASPGLGLQRQPGEGHQQNRANAGSVGECQPRVGAAATTLGKAINRAEQTLKALANASPGLGLAA